MHITSPYTSPNRPYLPGKDDNIYEFYGDNANNPSDYPDYYYVVTFKIYNEGSGLYEDKEVYKYKPSGSTPIRINIRNMLAPHFTHTFENELSTLVGYPTANGSKKVILCKLYIVGYYIEDSGFPVPHVVESGYSAEICYWDGTSHDFWQERYNHDEILTYIPTGTTYPSDRPQWVGPRKPIGSASTYIPNAAVSFLQQSCKNEMYEISDLTFRTVSAVIEDNGSYFNNTYKVACYDKDGKMTKTGLGNISNLLPSIDSRNKFITLPVGVPQINALASNSWQSGRIFFQLTAHGTSLGSQRQIDDKDEYYQIMLWNMNAQYDNQANASLPLTFHIQRRTTTGRNDLSHIDILYYSKLGGWWQIAAYNRNYKETSIKTESRKLLDTQVKTISARSRKTVHTNAEDYYTINTDWLNDREILEIEDMIQSPDIYLCNGGVYIPVTLTDSTYVIDTTDKRQLKSYTLKFTADYNKKTLR